MLAYEASSKDIQEMKKRLDKKKKDMIAQRQIDQVVRMVQKRPFVELPVEEVSNTEQEEREKNAVKAACIFMCLMVNAILWNQIKLPMFLFAVIYFAYRLHKHIRVCMRGA